jgi:uncharacterized protein YndB with AHSA1/START domain
MTSSDLGVIQGTADRRRVEVTRVINATIEDVWNALVDPNAISQWFATASIDPREGGRIELRFGERTVVHGVLKTFMPPNVLAYTWAQEGESTSLVQFDLIETGLNETLVTVVQTALDAPVAVDVASGWHTMLDRLTQFLLTREFVPLDEARMKKLYAAYQAAIE